MMQGGVKLFWPRNQWGARSDPQDHLREDANKIVRQVKQEKELSENLNFLIDLDTNAMVVKDKRTTE